MKEQYHRKSQGGSVVASREVRTSIHLYHHVLYHVWGNYLSSKNKLNSPAPLVVVLFNSLTWQWWTAKFVFKERKPKPLCVSVCVCVLPAWHGRRPSSLLQPPAPSVLRSGTAASPRLDCWRWTWQKANRRCARPRSWAPCTGFPGRLQHPDATPTAAYCYTHHQQNNFFFTLAHEDQKNICKS